MNNINSVIIPIAGKGTRFLPVTKTITKTMFPIINKPVLHYLLEEALNAGLTNIYIVINEEQEIIKNYLDTNSKYYEDLIKEYDELNNLHDILSKVKITYVIQDKPRGLGDAIYRCKDYIKGSFAVMLGDDLVISNSNKYGIYDLIDEYKKSPNNYLGVKQVEEKDTYKYGIVKLKGDLVIDMVEKPKTNPPSNYAAVGRYVFKNTIFDYLSTIKDDGVTEIQLTDAIIKAVNNEEVRAVNFSGTRFDIGDHAGYVLANIYASLHDENIKEKVIEYISKE